MPCPTNRTHERNPRVVLHPEFGCDCYAAITIQCLRLHSQVTERETRSDFEPLSSNSRAQALNHYTFPSSLRQAFHSQALRLPPQSGGRAPSTPPRPPEKPLHSPPGELRVTRKGTGMLPTPLLASWPSPPSLPRFGSSVPSLTSAL